MGPGVCVLLARPFFILFYFIYPRSFFYATCGSRCTSSRLRRNDCDSHIRKNNPRRPHSIPTTPMQHCIHSNTHIHAHTRTHAHTHTNDGGPTSETHIHNDGSISSRHDDAKSWSGCGLARGGTGRRCRTQGQHAEPFVDIRSLPASREVREAACTNSKRVGLRGLDEGGDSGTGDWCRSVAASAYCSFPCSPFLIILLVVLGSCNCVDGGLVHISLPPRPTCSFYLLTEIFRWPLSSLSMCTPSGLEVARQHGSRDHRIVACFASRGRGRPWESLAGLYE
ncbi:hypothetical protein VTK73DRAFT_2570 [Phialemonium thermophilum]|uniref:Uncharacterized protein n=1 Tax=Phialemonium thermophilum TaxID=223376 RepID=A0ABR3VRY6_9PEZI